MSSVIVSFPNPSGLGVKSHTVKTTPATPLTEVIAQVVTKFALGDPLAFGLSWRMANGSSRDSFPPPRSGAYSISLPPNTLGNPPRLPLNFSAFEKSPTEQTTEDGAWITPVFQLLNREVSGFAQLNETTLQSLGITSGNIVIRLGFRSTQVAYAEICSQIQAASANSQVLPIEAPQPKPKPVQEAKTPLASASSSDARPTAQHEGSIDRGIQVFKVAESEISLSARLDLPDSHFELSSTELKMAVSSQQARTRQLMEGAPLKTKAMVEKEKKRWLEDHPTTTLRVRLPDTTQLQATFRSLEPVSALGQVIRSSLHDARRPFVLSQAPPYRNLDPDSDESFYSLGLVPSAQIHLRFTDSQSDTPILMDALSASAEALPLPSLPPASDETPAPTNMEDGPREKPLKVEPRVEADPQGKPKLPKWLRLSK